MILVSDSNEYKKAKGVNKIAAAEISNNWYKDILLDKKYLSHSMNRFQSKNHRMGTYEINKVSLSCFDDSIYILNMELMC